MVSIWYRSDTYAHGFLILPFTLYMIWSKRNYLVALRHQSNPLALLVLCALGFIWLLAELASVQVLAQYRDDTVCRLCITGESYSRGDSFSLDLSPIRSTFW